jgi:dihydropyrimidinase
VTALDERVLAVVNARLVIPEIGVFRGGLRIVGERVAAVWEGDAPDHGADEVIDAAGHFVLPGLIDPHVHLGLLPPMGPRLAAESGFAASGGVTTLIQYFRRPESYLETFPAFLDAAGRNHLQDFAVHLTLFNRGQTAELAEYVRAFGVTSFKLYMMLKGRLGRGIIMDQLSEHGELTTADVDFDDGHLFDVFRTASGLAARVRINVHAENAEIVMHEMDRVRASGMDGLPAWHAARPGASEALAIQQVAWLSRRFAVPTYFPHIGSREGVEAVAEARTRGTDVGAETGPQYLALTIDDPVGSLAKITPPIRTADDQAEVWKALESGVLNTIGSDHIAYTNAEKQLGDVWSTRPAFGGIGLILPVLMTEGVHRGAITIRRLAQVTSQESARLFGLYPRKGTLLPGSDADFVIVDPDAEWVVRTGELPSSSEFSVFEGRSLRGRAVLTAVRGTVIYRDGQVVGRPGSGRYYRRHPAIESGRSLAMSPSMAGRPPVPAIE